MFRAIDSRDWRELPGFFDPEVVYERPGYDPFVGIDRLMTFYEKERVIAEGTHHLQSVLVDGDRAACWGRFVGKHRDGGDIGVTFADFHELRNGRIRARRSFFYPPAV
jgi:hypothetical protein